MSRKQCIHYDLDSSGVAVGLFPLKKTKKTLSTNSWISQKNGKGLSGNWDWPFNSTYIPSNSVVMSTSDEGSGGLTESEAIC